MKKLTIYAFALTTLFLTSCSGGDDSVATPPPPLPGDIPPIAGKFTKNVLIEDFTGTWCGYCPRVAYGISKVHDEALKAFPVAIHRGSTDPYDFAADALESAIGVTGYPTAKLDRKLSWNNETNTAEVKKQIKANSDLGLALTSTVSGGNINLDVKIKFDANLSGLKLVVYVLEDNLFYNQNNYTSYYGGASIIQNFEHDHVLRSCLTNLVDGDALAGTIDGATITKNFSIPVPNNVANVNNMNFVAFVIDSTGKAINVRGAQPNTTQTFQENQ